MAQAQELLVVGTSVQILGTQNVQARFPDFIGCTATVDKVPIHPSTWFSVKLHSTKQILKLQPTSLKIIQNCEVNKLAKSDANEKYSKNVLPESHNDSVKPSHGCSANVPHKPTAGRPRTNSYDSNTEKRNRSNSIDISHAHTLTLGAEVVIRATENVLQVNFVAFIIVLMRGIDWLEFSLICFAVIRALNIYM